MSDARSLLWRQRSQGRKAEAETPFRLMGDRGTSAGAPDVLPMGPGDDAWGRLRPLTLDPAALDRGRVITARRRDPAHGAFDVLRTKLLGALGEQGWRRVGITSPTKGCGKSFVSTNLAVSLARYRHCRTVLLDMDLRLPTVARKLGVAQPGAISGFLRGAVPPEAFLHRVNPGLLQIGPWLALGLNAQVEPFASELFFDPATKAALARMEEALNPQVVLLDLPPVLAQDDVLAIAPHLDCVVIVAEGGRTSSRELVETSRRLGDSVPILAVVLNKAEGEDILDYQY